MTKFPGENKERKKVGNFFTPTLPVIVIVVAFALLYVLLNPESPYNFALYPLYSLYYYVIQPLIIAIVINNPVYQGTNYYELFYTWMIPALSIPFFYVVACTMAWLYRYGKKRGPLASSFLAGGFLAWLFIVPAFVVPSIARAFAPASPEDILIVLHDKESCQSLPIVVSEHKGDSSTFTVNWDESRNICIFSGNFEIPYSYTSFDVSNQSSLMIRGENSTIRAELKNEGLIIVDTNSTFLSYGLSNDGVIHISKDGILDNRGMISSASRINIESGEILPTVPGKIQIINEGTLKNGGQFGYVENFGAIINRGGELLNDGEIVPFTNSTIINTGGGRIEIGAHGILGIANMTNENIGSVVENYGNFYNSGTIHNIDGAIITNDGFGKMTNQGYIYNQSIISNAGVGEITNDWKIYNGCEAVIEGEIKENLPIENCDQKL